VDLGKRPHIRRTGRPRPRRPPRQASRLVLHVLLLLALSPLGAASRPRRMARASYTELRRPKVLVHGTGTGPDFEERHVVPRLEKSLPDGVGMRLHCPALSGTNQRGCPVIR
jgi:hypothetical protein